MSPRSAETHEVRGGQDRLRLVPTKILSQMQCPGTSRPLVILRPSETDAQKSVQKHRTEDNIAWPSFPRLQAFIFSVLWILSMKYLILITFLKVITERVGNAS